LPIGLAVCVLILLAVLSRELQIDSVRGTFAADALVRAATERRHDRAVAARLDGMGSTFLVPIFFVTSGIRLDVASLFSDPVAVATVPLYVLVMLVARGAPAFLFYWASLSFPQRVVLALHSCTRFSLVVAITGVVERVRPDAGCSGCRPSSAVGVARISSWLRRRKCGMVRSRAVANGARVVGAVTG
jgi:Kef-type K+ transport system membrane component KefB